MSIIILLKAKEAEIFDSPFEFSEEDRKFFFTLTTEDNLEFRKIHTKIGYILQRGYFILQKKFFLPSQYHEKDIEYVTKLCKVNRKIDINQNYSRAICNFHKQLLLHKYGYSLFTDNIILFEKEAQELVKTPLRPKEIFYSLISFLNEKKIEIPKYYLFAKTIAKALNLFEKNLIKIVDKELIQEQKDILDSIMSLPLNVDNEISQKSPYLVTHLKKITQVITPRKIKQSLDDFNTIKELHEKFHHFFKTNIVSEELLNYYAVWVIKAEHIQFENISSIKRKRLYMIAFISYQYKMRQDYFVDTFFQSVQKYYNDVDKSVANSFLNKDIKLKKPNQLVKFKNIFFSFKERLDNIEQIVFSNSYYDPDKVKQIQDVFLFKNNRFLNEVLEEITILLENIGTKGIKDQLFYEELSNNYRKIHNRVAGILQILEFNPQTSDPKIIEAINYYQQKSNKITTRIPKAFINERDYKWLYSKNGEINLTIYKVFLFKEVSNHIKAGTLNLLFSERYKSIDDYMISIDRWRINRDELLERANLINFENIEETFSQLKNNLYDNYLKTNDNIKNNQYLKFTHNGVPRVSTPKASNANENVILDIIGNEKYYPLIKILSDIRYSTDFISSFIHYSRQTNKSTSDDIIYAAIIALGCNIGVRRMGRISNDIGADKLENAVRWFFSKENIDDANRKIISLTNNLPLSNIYRENQEKLSTSSDGQKFNITVPSLNATHSSKYFGTGKGVSAYSFIDEKGRLFYNTVISASERESTYVLDGLFHDEEVKSDIHSTDTHGFSEIIFGICNSLDISFSPRIKNYNEQLLYTFKDKTRNFYENQGFKILPSKSLYIDEKIICEQWDNILRLLCSIKLKETLPSNILKRLSSYSKQHPLYKAIKEIGRIHKTIFLLRYYDEVPLRQNIEKQLNRIELSHLFAKAVFFGNNQEFKYETKEEQEMALGCRHLIQNSIILWNYLCISEKLSSINNTEEIQKLIKSLKNNSIMTWQHINMHGEYNFKIDSNTIPFDVEKLKSLKIN